MLEAILTLVVIIGLAVVALLWRTFLPAYTKKKGENLATKEDIEDITTKIESVKSEIQTLSKLKADYAQHRRDTLLNFYEVAAEFLYVHLIKNIGDIPIQKGERIIEYEDSFRIAIVSVMKLQMRVNVYFGRDEKIYQSVNDVTDKIIKASTYFEKNFAPLKISIMDIAMLPTRTTESELIGELDENQKRSRAYYDGLNPLTRKVAIAVKQLQEDLNEYLSRIHKESAE